MVIKKLLLLLLFILPLNAILLGKKPEPIHVDGFSIYIDGKANFKVWIQSSYLVTEGKNAIGICKKVEFIPQNSINLKRCVERKVQNICGYNATPIFAIEMAKKEKYIIYALSENIIESNENLSVNPYFLVGVPDTIILYKNKEEEDKDNSDELLIVPIQDGYRKRSKAYLLNILETRTEYPIILEEIICEK